jgi:hypothetical protein
MVDRRESASKGRAQCVAVEEHAIEEQVELAGGIAGPVRRSTGAASGRRGQRRNGQRPHMLECKLAPAVEPQAECSLAQRSHIESLLVERRREQAAGPAQSPPPTPRSRQAMRDYISF